MKSFQTYQDFLIFLIKNPASPLVENSAILEKFIPMNVCFHEEPHLFDTFVSQCSTALEEADKANFESFVQAYLSLKFSGFFDTETTSEQVITVEKKQYPEYTSSMLDFSEISVESLYV